MADIPMPDRKQLEALRGKLAAATARDWEVNSAIARVVLGWSWRNEIETQPKMKPAGWYAPDGKWRHDTPNWSGSMDVAATLVPERWLNAWSVGIGWPSIDGHPWASYGGNRFSAVTQAIALCLARVEYELAKTEPT